MLAGLMSATLLSGIAPAYAQNEQRERGNRSERMQRPDRGGGEMRGNRMAQQRQMVEQQAQRPRRDMARPTMAQRAQQQRDQQAASPRTANAMEPYRQDRREQRRADPRVRAMPDRNLPNRAVTVGQREGWQDRREERRDVRRDVRDDRRDGRQDWRDDRRVDRRDVRDDRRDDRWDGRDDRRNDRRWDNNRGWVGGVGNSNWNNGRRYDDRTRWSNQRRWDNGWRQDRRYDWNNYRSRNGNQFRMGRYAAPRGWDYGYRRFSVGITLSSLLYANNYWLNDPYAYRLPPAYGTLRWVRYYDDAMLVDVRDGYVVDVIHGFFW